MKELVVVPAYNEAENIAEVIQSLREAEPGVDILVVNDGSSDETGEILAGLGVSHLNLPVNIGYGGALQSGFLYALKGSYECVYQFDGDGQHDPKSIRLLRNAMRDSGADIVIGSRFLTKEGQRPGLVRAWGIRFFRGVVWLLSGKRMTDVTSGLQALNRRAFTFYASERWFPDDFPDADVVLRMLRDGFRIAEVGTPMHARRGGSSMHGGARAFVYVLKMLLAMFVVMLEPRRERGQA